MRIRRRPQAPSLQPSDPSTSAAIRTPQNAGAAARNQERLDEDGSSAGPHAGLDLGQKSGVARRLALPLVDNAADCFRSLGAQQQGGVDVQRSVVSNGQRGADRIKDEAACTGGGGGTGTYEWVAKVEGQPRNGVAAPLILAVKEEENGSGGGGGAGGAKKRRGPAVLVEGSRCSRVNGRGWRCSQPTPVGYALCEHHLGKGRMRSAAAGSGRAGAGGGQLGRTEHSPRIPATPGAVAVTAAAAPLAPSPSSRRV